MDFALFLLLNATLFIRPAEIIPDLVGLPIYNVLILLNLALASSKIVVRLSLTTLLTEPITACVLGLLASIFLSHATHFSFLLAGQGAFEFLKVVLYYMLLIAVLDSTERLRLFLAALVIFISILTSLALLQYHGTINIPSLDAFADREIDAETGDEYMVMRLRSTGIYNDPNDLSLILIVGTGACLFLAGPRPGGLPKPYWLAPAGVFLYALTLTHSRGGFLALLAGMLVLFYARFGLKKAVLLTIMALPVMFILFAGRQTDISAGEDTGQDRIQLWAQGFIMFCESPIFGIGQNLYAERAGLVAHNSFVHPFAELGFLGGSLFLGAFAYALRTLLILCNHAREIDDPVLARFSPYLLGMAIGYAFGMLTITRNYVVPTYMILGLVAAYLRLVAANAPALVGTGRPISILDQHLLGRMGLISIAFLVVTNAFVKFYVRYS